MAFVYTALSVRPPNDSSHMAFMAINSLFQHAFEAQLCVAASVLAWLDGLCLQPCLRCKPVNCRGGYVAATVTAVVFKLNLKI